MVWAYPDIKMLANSTDDTLKTPKTRILTLLQTLVINCATLFSELTINRYILPLKKTGDGVQGSVCCT